LFVPFGFGFGNIYEKCHQLLECSDYIEITYFIGKEEVESAK
jgi:hypothetical protein